MKSRVLAGFLVALALLLPAAPVHAQRDDLLDRVAVDVGLVEVRARPGTAAIDRIKLINKTAEQQKLSVFVEDLGVDADGDILAVGRGTGQSSAAAWITTDPATVTVAPSGSSPVAIKINVPAGTKPGGYYASVTFDDENGRAPENRIVHSILIRVDGAGAQASVQLTSVSLPTISLAGRPEVRAVVENTGNVHAIGGGTIRISNFGSRIATIQIPPFVVLPGIQRIVTVPVRSAPIAGRLKADADLTFGDTTLAASSSGFVVIWWLAAAMLFVILLFLIALLRLLGLLGPKARARKKERIAADHARRAQKAARKPAKKGKEEPAATPPVEETLPVTPAQPPFRPAAQTGTLAERLARRPKPDSTFWGDEEEGPAPFADVEKEEEIVEMPALSDFDPFKPAEAPEEPEEPEPAELLDDGPLDLALDDEQPVALDLEADEDTTEPEPEESEPEEPEVQAAWPGSPDAPPSPQPSKPVAVSLSPSQRPAPLPLEDADEISIEPSDDHIDDDDLPMLIEDDEFDDDIRPPARPIHVANIPPRPSQAPLPVAPVPAAPPPEVQLERTGAGSAMAIRRAEVALRMITGKPGETGAILDAGLDLLYSVRSDADVIRHIEGMHADTRNRRKLGPLALALFAVDSRTAPRALLDAYATASKVVADRIRRAILACDPADIRPHRDLIGALPPARRDALGL